MLFLKELNKYLNHFLVFILRVINTDRYEMYKQKLFGVPVIFKSMKHSEDKNLGNCCPQRWQSTKMEEIRIPE